MNDDHSTSTPMPRRLFYPCCGTDFAEAIAFGQRQGVEEFWFVDLGYRAPFTRVRHALREVVGDADETTLQMLAPEGEPWQAPALTHRVGERKYVLVAGKGVSIMRHFLPQIAVFFYRGDGMGEGGSGNIWLGNGLFPQLVERLQPESWVVTDGSNGSMSGSLRQISRFLNRRGLDPQQVLAELSGFTSHSSRLGGPVTFSPVEVLGERYGPTVAWRVQRHGGAPLQPMR